MLETPCLHGLPKECHVCPELLCPVGIVALLPGRVRGIKTLVRSLSSLLVSFNLLSTGTGIHIVCHQVLYQSMYKGSGGREEIGVKEVHAKKWDASHLSNEKSAPDASYHYAPIGQYHKKTNISVTPKRIFQSAWVVEICVKTVLRVEAETMEYDPAPTPLPMCAICALLPVSSHPLQLPLTSCC